MYYKENGRHVLMHTYYARGYRSEEELQNDPNYMEKHWLIKVKGVGQRVVSYGYKKDKTVYLLIRKNILNVESIQFLEENKPLTVQETYKLYRFRSKVSKT